MNWNFLGKMLIVSVVIALILSIVWGLVKFILGLLFALWPFIVAVFVVLMVAKIMSRKKG